MLSTQCHLIQSVPRVSHSHSSNMIHIAKYAKPFPILLQLPLLNSITGLQVHALKIAFALLAIQISRLKFGTPMSLQTRLVLYMV